MTRKNDAVVVNGTAQPTSLKTENPVEKASVQIVMGGKDARDKYMMFVGTIFGGFLALISLILGILDWTETYDVPDTVAFSIVGFWVLVPPIFLWALD